MIGDSSSTDSRVVARIQRCPSRTSMPLSPATRLMSTMMLGYASGAKLVLIMANTFFAVAVALASAFAILTLSFKV